MRIIFEFGSKGINSVLRAYRETIKTKPNTNTNNNKEEEKKKSSFMNFNSLITTPMSREEALKILNLKEDQVNPENIMNQFEKYFEGNDPEKGGSFYLQNKIYYAKEILMEKFSKEMNKSKFNPGSGSQKSNEGNNTQKEKEEDDLDKNINNKI